MIIVHCWHINYVDDLWDEWLDLLEDKGGGYNF